MIDATFKPEWGAQLDPSWSETGDLIALWLMNEGDGPLVGDSVAAQNLSLSGGVTWGGSRDGYAMKFDGSTGLLTGPVIPAASTPPVSIAAWINPTDVSSGIHTITACGDSGLQFRHDGAQLRFVKGGVADIGLGSSVLTANEIQFVVGTYDAAGKFLFYRNGAAAGGGANLQSLTTTNNATIGARVSSGIKSELFSGSILSVSMYRGILTPEQVASLYSRPYQMMQDSAVRRAFPTQGGGAAPATLFRRNINLRSGSRGAA